jgi:precorrin-3B C17-methyltransferase
MLTTVLIGNSNTFVRHGLMVTPRGYANKYDMDSHGAHAGEKAGRSLSTGLLGWLEALSEAHAAGDSVATLAERYQLPAAYIESTLAERVEPADDVAEREETDA